MVDLSINNNEVLLSKSEEDYQNFINNFLVKYETVSRIDPYRSTKSHRVLRTEKVRRNLFVDQGDAISFSRGLLSVIPESEYRVTDILSKNLYQEFSADPEEIKHSLPSFDLREDQVLAVLKCLYMKRGVIQLPTAVGKSSIITATVKQILSQYPESKILVLAPTLSTVEGINKTLLRNEIDSTIFGHPNKEVTQVTSALVQSLVSYSETCPDFLEGVNAVFYDECLPGNSQVLLSDGSTRSIKEIYEDDSINEVMSYNIETNKYEIKRILRKFKTPFNSKFWRVYYKDPVTEKVQGASFTDNHKVYTQRGYVQVKDLTKEDKVKIDFPFCRCHSSMTSATYIKIIRVSPNIGSVSKYKYNLEVEDNHNYFASRLLVSNCHHLKCDTWCKLNSLLKNVEVSLGFSALSVPRSEIYLTDIRDMSYETSLIVGSTGRVLMHMDPSYYIERGIIALPIVFQINNHIDLPKGFDETSWSNLTKEGLMSDSRTKEVCSVARVFSHYQRKVLILVSERDYAFKIGEFLARSSMTSFGISFGAGTGYICQELKEDGEVCYHEVDSLSVLDSLSQGDISVVIGTSHIDEGVDLQSLDCLILACGGKKDRKVIQRVGRVLRKSKTGKYAYVVDFSDKGSRVLSRQSTSRLKMYREVIGVPDNNVFLNLTPETLHQSFLKLEGLI